MITSLDPDTIYWNSRRKGGMTTHSLYNGEVHGVWVLGSGKSGLDLLSLPALTMSGYGWRRFLMRRSFTDFKAYLGSSRSIHGVSTELPEYLIQYTGE